MSLLLVLGCWLTCLVNDPASPLDQQQGEPPVASFDVLHYDLSMNFNLPQKTFTGRVVIHVRALTSLTEMTVDAASATLVIDSVRTRGGAAAFHHASDLLSVQWSQPVAAQSEFDLTISYHGSSTYSGQYDGGGVYFISPSRLATISEPNFARTWWPCVDRPSDKATAAMTISVPESLTAVSNGVLRSVTRHSGTATYSWETDYPIATYLVSAAAAVYREYSEPYRRADGTDMKIVYYLYPEDEERGKVDFQNTKKILEFFSRRFCEYPFIREKFGFAEVDGNTTMEHQTLCSIQKDLIRGDRSSELTLLHETAHHWWGDLITPINWKHTWLSEGFATYAEALYLEEAAGKDSSRKYVERWMDAEPGTYAGSVIGKTDTAFWDAFAPRVYNKGAIVLHMLRAVVGDTIFFAIMRNYLNDPKLRYGNAATDDFIAECERTSGKNLKWFFHEWVYASADSVDRPAYEYDWTTNRNGSSFDVRVFLNQTTAGKLLFRMPMTVTLLSAKSQQTFPVVDSLASQTFSFVTVEPPTDVLIDKEHDVFKVLKRAEKR